MANNSHFLHPASDASNRDIVPNKIAIPNVLRIVVFSSVFTFELYTRMLSMCNMPNGGGAMNPSCVATTSASSASSLDVDVDVDASALSRARLA